MKQDGCAGGESQGYKYDFGLFWFVLELHPVVFWVYSSPCSGITAGRLGVSYVVPADQTWVGFMLSKFPTHCIIMPAWDMINKYD